MNQGPFPPPTLPGFFGNMGLSDFPPSPALPSRVASCFAAGRRTGRDLPCCYRTPLANMRSSIRRWTRTALFSLSYCPVAAFPLFELGRHPHQMVSGLARCSFALRPAASLTRYRAFCTKGFEHFITSMLAPAATGWNVSCRAGLFTLPLEFCAFPRRTQTDSENGQSVPGLCSAGFLLSAFRMGLLGLL